MYRDGFADLPEIVPLVEEPGIRHAYHLFVITVAEGRVDVQ